MEAPFLHLDLICYGSSGHSLDDEEEEIIQPGASKDNHPGGGNQLSQSPGLHLDWADLARPKTPA